MKTQEIIDKAVVVVVTLIAAALIVLLAIARSAEAADYWILKDQAGKIVITDQKPQVGQTVIKHYEWQNVSTEEVRAAQAAEAAIRAEVAAQERTRAIEKLAEQIGQWSMVNGQSSGQPPQIMMGTSVGGTTVKPRIIVRGKDKR